MPRYSKPILLLCATHAFALFSMYGLAYRNGYLKALLRLKDFGPHLLPGSENPILKTYTGIAPLDKLITIAVVLFANITDGSAPHFSLYGFHFGGQLTSIWTVLMIEGYRFGNRGTPLSLSVLWGCAMQGLGYGCIMPLYGILHLYYSSASSSDKKELATSLWIKNQTLLKTLPLSIIIGYIVPSILIAIPFASNNLHQWLVGFWQGVPVWMALLQYIAGIVSNNTQCLKTPASSSPANKTPNISTRIRELMSLQDVYRVAFDITAVTHVTTMMIIAARNLCPVLFSQWGLSTLTFRDVFLPPSIFSDIGETNMATAAQNFLQYDQYVGSAAAIIWAMALCKTTRKTPMSISQWLLLAGEALGVTLLAGPCGAVIALMWNRDERIIGDDDLYKANERKGLLEAGRC
ncbi:hypothetical protein TWF173_002134 [Orbilia oligospora]|nr:hypothetical protein TWF970_004307 [Orbilia oligospora]KAF3307848.1 hypothetical protein TWF173_002134 [Orbilia oligospora]